MESDRKSMPLDYGSSTDRRARRVWLGWLVGLLLAGFILLDPLYIPIRQDCGWVDAISGSQRSQTIWGLGNLPTRTIHRSPPVVRISPLERRFRQLGLTWQPDWRLIQGTSRNLLGQGIGSGHGPAPPILTLATSSALQQAYLQYASDQEVRQLFQILTTGGENQQQAALDAACNRVLTTLEARE